MYCIGKSALEMLIENISVEYSDYSCFNIDPGVMDTKMQSKIRDFEEGENNQYFIELFKNKKLKDTEEVAKNILEGYVKWY